MIDQATLAKSILDLLQTDPSRYKSFGCYWPLVKALLKKHYTRENLFLLGDHVDPEAASHMPPHASLAEALEAAVEFHRNHSAYGLGGATFHDAETGAAWTLRDPDAGGI